MTNHILIHGRFFRKNGERFLVRGIVFQLHDLVSSGPNNGIPDPIVDDRNNALRQDVAILTELGVNTIYVYSIDRTKAHSQAMKLLEDAGIHVLVSVTTLSKCIHRNSPHGSYNADVVKSFFETVDVMAEYTNTLGILIADQLINNDKSQFCAPVLVAVCRDIKKYMRLKHEVKGQRVLPVGYGGASIDSRDLAILEYLSSRDEEERIDFWTTKCSSREKRDVTADGFRNLAKRFGHIGIPIFFSEYYSLNGSRPRQFNETEPLYDKIMTSVFSGGCVYELWQGGNKYGLVRNVRTDQGTDHDSDLIGDEAESRKLDSTRDIGRNIVRRVDHPGRTIFIYEDFDNYKAGLGATRDAQPAIAERVVEDTDSDISQRWAWSSGLPGAVPASCVDWTEIERHLRSHR